MSLKGDKYETTEEVNFRLKDTVVLYDGKPVYITQVRIPEAEDGKEIARVFFKELPIVGRGGRETRKFLSSRKFDLTPFKMGYMNFSGSAVFVSRSPVRQNRQGLSQAVTTFTDCKGRRYENITFNLMLQSLGFVDMVNGKYPSFKDAGELLGDNETSSVAVSRTFAFVIYHDLEALLLLHKGTRCGIALKEDKAVKVPPKFHFLREEMEEHRIPLA